MREDLGRLEYEAWAFEILVLTEYEYQRYQSAIQFPDETLFNPSRDVRRNGRLNWTFTSALNLLIVSLLWITLG